MAIDLFQKIDFKSHGGLDLSWKIEMDALSDNEWKCIAHMINDLSIPFQAAIGIPRGGVKLGQYLNEYSTQIYLTICERFVYFYFFLSRLSFLNY